MSVKVLYRTSARATGGRDGHSATLDGAVDVNLRQRRKNSAGRRRRRQPRAAVRHRLCRLLHRRHEVRGLAGRTESARRYRRHRNRRHRAALGRRLRPRYRARNLLARRRPAGSRGAADQAQRSLYSEGRRDNVDVQARPVRLGRGFPVRRRPSRRPRPGKLKNFVVYTGSETWAGAIHPVQALREYREKTGIAAKLVVVGMVSNGFSIADPDDGGMLDVVGFDAAARAVNADFIRG